MTKCARVVVVYRHSILLISRNKFGDQYYTLPGGHIEPGETAEAAAVREVMEEASITIGLPRLVFIEQGTRQYPAQYIFAADYVDGDARLSPRSDEAIQNAKGQNTYRPVWVPVSKLAGLRLVSPAVKEAVLQGLSGGFPQEPKMLTADQ